jgi:hypothetical protein
VLIVGTRGVAVIVPGNTICDQRSSSSASVTSIDGSGPPRSRAAWRRVATNRSSESMVSMSRIRTYAAWHPPKARSSRSTCCPVTELPTRRGGRAFNPFAPPSIKGRRLSDPEVPTKLAHLSVIRAGLAIAHSVSVHASLVGSGIGGADTGIFGVCLCWWNAEGCQCYG